MNRYLGIALRHKPRKFLAPLQQHQIAFFGEEFVKAKSRELSLGVDAVEVHVVQRYLRTTVFLH